MARYSTSYYKYGRQALNDVLNVFDQLRRQREERDFYNNLLNVYNEAIAKQKQISEGFDPNDIRYVPGKSVGEEIQLGKDKINMESPGDYILGDYIPPTQEIKSIPNIERYKRAKNILGEFQENVLPILLNKNIDENKAAKINLLGNLLSQKAESLKPQQPEAFNLGRGESRFIQYPGTEPIKIAEGQPYEQKEQNPFTKVGADGYIYQWDFEKKQFVKTNLRAPEKEWQFKSDDNKEKSKSLSPATSKLIADIVNPNEYVTDEYGNVLKFAVDDKGNYVRDEKTGQYKLDPAGVPMKISETEKKYRQENALQNVKLQTLGPRSYEFVENIEKLWGRRLSPKELKDEAIKHARAGNLSDEEASEIADFLKYYSVIYQGLK